MSRQAKPIETLLKLKQIKPDLEFQGADKYVYDEFLAEQAEASLMATLEAQEEKKTKKSKRSKKVKQTVPEEIVETGSMEFEEPAYEENNENTEESV